MIIAKYLWIVGSLIILSLGIIHLFYTFFSNKFSPRNTQLEDDMKTTSPLLTKETTMWKAWLGFNGSHSSGAIFIGAINVYLALRYFSIFQSDHFFFILNISTIIFYAWLGKKYWFKIPLIGISTTLICYLTSYILTIISR